MAHAFPWAAEVIVCSRVRSIHRHGHCIACARTDRYKDGRLPGQCRAIRHAHVDLPESWEIGLQAAEQYLRQFAREVDPRHAVSTALEQARRAPRRLPRTDRWRPARWRRSESPIRGAPEKHPSPGVNPDPAPRPVRQDSAGRRRRVPARPMPLARFQRRDHCRFVARGQRRFPRPLRPAPGN